MRRFAAGPPMSSRRRTPCTSPSRSGGTRISAAAARRTGRPGTGTRTTSRGTPMTTPTPRLTLRGQRPGPLTARGSPGHARPVMSQPDFPLPAGARSFIERRGLVRYTRSLGARSPRNLSRRRWATSWRDARDEIGGALGSARGLRWFRLAAVRGKAHAEGGVPSVVAGRLWTVRGRCQVWCWGPRCGSCPLLLRARVSVS